MFFNCKLDKFCDYYVAFICDLLFIHFREAYFFIINFIVDELWLVYCCYLLVLFVGILKIFQCCLLVKVRLDIFDVLADVILCHKMLFIGCDYILC